MKIIKTAAELIRSDISSMETNKETYPTTWISSPTVYSYC